MNDTFLPGNGFDTYEEQDRVLMGLSGSVRSGVAVRILQQQGFAVAAAVVRLADTPEEHAAVDAARALAKKLDVECVTLNAEALAGQDAEAARFAALLTAADKLGIQYIASGRYARIETDAQGMSHLFAPESGAPDESGKLAALPPEVMICSMYFPDISCRWAISPRRTWQRWRRILSCKIFRFRSAPERASPLKQKSPVQFSCTGDSFY